MKFFIQSDFNARDLFGTLHNYFISTMSDIDKIVVAVLLAVFGAIVVYIMVKVLIFIWKK